MKLPTPVEEKVDIMSVPKFCQPMALENVIPAEPLAFYKTIEPRLLAGQYVEIEGNISYIFVFLYKQLAEWKTSGFSNLQSLLAHIRSLYVSEPKIVYYCDLWHAGCFIGLGQYETFLAITEPASISSAFDRRQTLLRLSCQFGLRIPANLLDIARLANRTRSTFFTDLYPDVFFQAAAERFQQHILDHGPWIAFLMNKEVLTVDSRGHSIFPMVPFHFSEDRPKLSFLSLTTKGNVATTKSNLAYIDQLLYDSENLARQSMNLPMIGEGWIGETELYYFLNEKFPTLAIVQHGKPAFLGRQHFDIWIEKLKLAIEYHGEQHFQPVGLFGGDEAFAKTVERDERKRTLSSLYLRHSLRIRRIHVLLYNLLPKESELVGSELNGGQVFTHAT